MGFRWCCSGLREVLERNFGASWGGLWQLISRFLQTQTGPRSHDLGKGFCKESLVSVSGEYLVGRQHCVPKLGPLQLSVFNNAP